MCATAVARAERAAFLEREPTQVKKLLLQAQGEEAAIAVARYNPNTVEIDRWIVARQCGSAQTEQRAGPIGSDRGGPAK